MTESTAVTPDGRISQQATGLWNSQQVEAWRRIIEFVHARDTHIGVQLGHAGRKSSTYATWRGSGSVPADQGGWQAQAPSAIAFGRYAAPAALTVGEIAGIGDRLR
jgi:2,4-dienoyl-CoA reductase-like NADH-dependent reductase (Old Yellow Enzyme family)